MKTKILIFVSLFFFLDSSFLIHNCSCQWVQMSNGIGNNLLVRSLAVSGNTIFAGVFSTANYGVFFSTDYGQNWIKTALNDKSVYSLAISGNNLMNSGQVILAGTWTNGLWISTNNGQSWTQSGFYDIQSFATIGNNVFAGTFGNGIYLSTNNGLNWTQTAMNNNAVFSLAASGNNIFAGLNLYGVHLSTNNGQTWTQTALNDKNVHSLAISGNNIFAGSTRVYYSTNNGQNWTQTALHDLIKSLTIKDNSIIAGTYNSGVCVSKNNGQNWIQKNEGFSTIPKIENIVIMNNYVFAATYGNSVWRRELWELLDVKNISTEIPSAFSLSQNYPNPFNAMTKIQFNVPSQKFVKLAVFDILGKEVATLVNESLQPGTYETTFDASNLSSGIYFYQLRSDNFIQTKKLTLIK